jgi:hypothetical protein
MTRRCVFRVLLSLVLLLSQQMAMSHALSHWSSQLGGPRSSPVLQQAAIDSDLSSAFAQDRSCAQCLGLAQLGAPLASSPRQFVAPDMADVCAPDAATLAWRVRSARLYDSRAPPVPG